jgi:hypothetical protein
MTQKTDSIDTILRKEGWLLRKVIPKKDLPTAIVEAAISVAEKKYFSDYQVHLDKIALGTIEWMPKDESYFLYLKPTKNYFKEKKGSMLYLSVMSKHSVTGEESYQHY